METRQNTWNNRSASSSFWLEKFWQKIALREELAATFAGKKALSNTGPTDFKYKMAANSPIQIVANFFI